MKGFNTIENGYRYILASSRRRLIFSGLFLFVCWALFISDWTNSKSKSSTCRTCAFCPEEVCPICSGSLSTVSVQTTRNVDLKATSCARIAAEKSYSSTFNEIAQFNTLHMALGQSEKEVSKSLSALSAAHPDLAADTAAATAYLAEFSRCVLDKISGKEEIVLPVDSIGSNINPTIVSATFGKPGGARYDVAWRLRPLVDNGVLRVPVNYPAHSLFGDLWPGYAKTLEVTASLPGLTEPLMVSVPTNRNGLLREDLIISAAPPSRGGTLLQASEVANLLRTKLSGLRGVEIGGPSGQFQSAGVYKAAASVDLVNFSEKTMWGDLKHGTTIALPGGGTGRTFISDGSTLLGLDDGSYDFVLGSHYLEHLSNPLRALVSMRRVLKPGGLLILILPAKEKTFDVHRGVASVEDLIYRYLVRTDESDMTAAHIDLVALQSSLQNDPGLLSQASSAWSDSPYEYFLGRSMNNFAQRGIHQFVYDVRLLKSLMKVLNFEVILGGTDADIDSSDQWIIATKK